MELELEHSIVFIIKEYCSLSEHFLSCKAGHHNKVHRQNRMEKSTLSESSLVYTSRLKIDSPGQLEAEEQNKTGTSSCNILRLKCIIYIQLDTALLKNLIPPILPLQDWRIW